MKVGYQLNQVGAVIAIEFVEDEPAVLEEGWYRCQSGRFTPEEAESLGKEIEGKSLDEIRQIFEGKRQKDSIFHYVLQSLPA